MRFYQLTPNYIVHEIDKILFCQQGDIKQICPLEMRKAIKQEQEKVKQAEYRMLNKIKPLPAGLFVENKGQMAGYTFIAKNNEHAKKEVKEPKV